MTSTAAPTASRDAHGSDRVSSARRRYQKHAPLQPAQRGGGLSSIVTRPASDALTTPSALQPEGEMTVPRYSGTSDVAIVRTVSRGTSPIAVTLRPLSVIVYAFVLPTFEKPSATSDCVRSDSMNTETVASPSE